MLSCYTILRSCLIRYIRNHQLSTSLRRDVTLNKFPLLLIMMLGPMHTPVALGESHKIVRICFCGSSNCFQSS